MSTHKYLNTTGLGQVWEKVKDYADPFVVTITSTTSAGTTTYSADKTFSEITMAYNNGKHCIAVSGANIYFLTVISSNLCRFINHAIGTTTGLGTADSVGGYKITNSNVVTRDSMIIYSSAKNFEIFAGRNSVVPKHNKDVNGSYVNNQAQQYYYEGDLFWNDKDLLCKAMTDISNGATLTENTNYYVTTIENELNEKITQLIGSVSIDGTTATFSGLSANEIFQAWGNNIPVYFKELTGEGGNEYRKYLLTHCWGGNYITMEFYSIYVDSYYNIYSLISIQASVSRSDDTLTTFTGTVTYVTIPNPEDDINIINLLAEYDFVAPIEDADGYVITDVDDNLIVI